MKNLACGSGLLRRQMTRGDYIKEADMVWIARDGYLDTIPRGLRSTAIVLKCLPPPNEYWYEVLQTTPSGKTQIKTYPIDMITKIEDNE